MSDIHDLVAAYALDAVDDQERTEFEAHLETCADCRAELADLTGAVDHLATVESTEPPAHLKDSVMSAIDDRPTSLDHRRRNRMVTRFVGLAAVAAMIIFGIVFVNGRETRQIDAVLNSPDAVQTAMNGTHGTAAFTFSADRGEGVFHGENLVDLPDDQVYQLWVIAGAAPIPSSTFTPQGNGEVLMAGLSPGQVIAYTVEPAGGSQSPTTDPLAAAELQ
jgi:anti-sigma-K factor RskA